MSLTYVYALIEAPSDRGAPHARTIRVLGRTIQLLRIGDVCAAIEDRDAPPPLSEASLRLQHRIVVALARRFDPLLPVRFGAAVEAAELEQLVSTRRTTLQRGFDLVRGREQMTVRIFGTARASRARRTGTEYLRGQHRAAQLVVPAAGGRIRRAVRGLIEKERVDAGRGRIRATLHHLVPRGLAEEYRCRVRRSLEGMPLLDDVVISGPWPPFAFTPDVWP